MLLYTHTLKKKMQMYTHIEKSTKLKGERWVPFDLGKFLLFSFLFIYFHFFFLQTRQWGLNIRNETSLEEFIRKMFLKSCLFLMSHYSTKSMDFGLKFLTACIEFLL